MGSNWAPDTPGPVQTPLIPSCIVFNVIELSNSQKGPIGVSTGAVASVTITSTVLGNAHSPVFGVNVIVCGLAAEPAVLGSKLDPTIPGPVQTPSTPSCVVLNGNAMSVSQNGPIAGKFGMAAALTTTCIVLN